MIKQWLILLLLFSSALDAQELSNRQLKKMNLMEYHWDPNNGDGVLIGKDRRSKKWGMYQVYSETEWENLIPAVYDSLDFLEFNGLFTGVWSEGKVGIYLSPWSSDTAYQSVPCTFDAYKKYTVEWLRHSDGGYSYPIDLPYVAVQRNGLWAWIDWYTGEIKTDFIYDLNQERMPYPAFEQKF